jgi:DNA polymerase-3 subunit gamma/tau
LLKTLEEPPNHAIFVLATTEAHKVPLTIISRCQRFDFKRISNNTTVERLAKLCADERVEATAECLGLIARSATGSLRDAENLLEQAVVSYGSPLTEDSVVDLLGIGNDHRALDLVGHVVDRNTKEGLTLINQVVTDGADIRQFRRVLTEYMRDVMLLKAGTRTSTGYSEGIIDRMCEIADRASLEHLVSALKMFINTDAGLDSASPVPLELAIVESAIDVGVDPRSFVAEVPSVSSDSNDTSVTVLDRSSFLEHNKVSKTPDHVSVTESVGLTDSPKQVKHQSSQNTVIDIANEPTNEPDSMVGEVAQIDAVNEDSLEGKWEEVLKLLNRQKGRRFNLGALMRVSVGRDVSDGLIELKYSHASHRERMRQELEDPKVSRLVGNVVETVLGKNYDIRISEGEISDNFSEVKPAQKSHLVRAAIALGAQISGEKENKKP